MWSFELQQHFPNTPFFSLVLFPSAVFSDLWSRDQEAGDSLCSSEPNQNRGGALQSSASAADTEGLPGAGMPQLESQQVEGGMFVLFAISSGSPNSLSGSMIRVTAASSWGTNTAEGFPEVADVGYVHTEHLSNHRSVCSRSNVMCHFPLSVD